MSTFILRDSFLYLSRQPQLRKWVETSPAAARITSRFVAGLYLEDALRVAMALKRDGTLVTLDHLGENVTSIGEANQAREAYLAAQGRLADLGLGATISVKLTALGLDLSEHVCRENLSALVERAAALGSRVEMDMEDSTYTDRTLALVREMHGRYPGRVRAVIQAYLYRSEADVRQLCAERIPVRLCKGAYKEPPEVAFPDKSDVDASYRKLMDLLLEQGTHPALASHDPQMLEHAFARIGGLRLQPDQFEFQMLYGVRRDLQRKVLEAGYALRLYLPYGTAWYPYFMRRLAERPANVWFIARNMFRR